MKVERNEDGFRPVIITLETKAEFKALRTVCEALDSDKLEELLYEELPDITDAEIADCKNMMDELWDYLDVFDEDFLI